MHLLIFLRVGTPCFCGEGSEQLPVYGVYQLYTPYTHSDLVSLPVPVGPASHAGRPCSRSRSTSAGHFRGRAGVLYPHADWTRSSEAICGELMACARHVIAIGQMGENAPASAGGWDGWERWHDTYVCRILLLRSQVCTSSTSSVGEYKYFLNTLILAPSFVYSVCTLGVLGVSSINTVC